MVEGTKVLERAEETLGACWWEDGLEGEMRVLVWGGGRDSEQKPLPSGPYRLSWLR